MNAVKIRRAIFEVGTILIGFSLLLGPCPTGWAAEPNSQPTTVAQANDSGLPPPNTGGQNNTTTRSLFFATLIPNLAQGLATKLIDWFGEKVLTSSGKVESAAAGSKQSAEAVNSANSPVPGATASTVKADLHAGIAYEVYLQQPDLKWSQVNPQAHTFGTGQRFVVVYRPNLPGRVEVFNRNPTGQENAIDSIYVSGGQLVTLGPYEFLPPKGDEILKIVLSPCVSTQAPVITRDIARVGNGDASVLPFQLSNCASKSDAPPVGIRSIQKVAVEGGTTFGIDKLSDLEQQSGNVLPRSLVIALQHR